MSYYDFDYDIHEKHSFTIKIWIRNSQSNGLNRRRDSHVKNCDFEMVKHDLMLEDIVDHEFWQC